MIRTALLLIAMLASSATAVADEARRVVIVELGRGGWQIYGNKEAVAEIQKSRYDLHRPEWKDPNHELHAIWKHNVEYCLAAGRTWMALNPKLNRDAVVKAREELEMDITLITFDEKGNHVIDDDPELFK